MRIKDVIWKLALTELTLKKVIIGEVDDKTKTKLLAKLTGEAYLKVKHYVPRGDEQSHTPQDDCRCAPFKERQSPPDGNDYFAVYHKTVNTEYTVFWDSTKNDAPGA